MREAIRVLGQDYGEWDGAAAAKAALDRLLATREAAVEHLRAVLEHVKRNADMEYESPTVREARAFLAAGLQHSPLEDDDE
jgi:hypothetical protein